MNRYIIIVLFLGYIGAQEFGWWRCPDPPPKSNFNMNLFSGTWYESGRYFSAYEIQGICPYVYIGGSSPNWNVTQRQLFLVDQKGKSLIGSATLDNSTVGKITVDFGHKRDYIILDTDYITYASVYSCYDYWFFHFKSGYTYTRTRGVANQTAFNRAKTAFATAGLPTNINATEQLFCVLFN